MKTINLPKVILHKWYWHWKRDEKTNKCIEFTLHKQKNYLTIDYYKNKWRVGYKQFPEDTGCASDIFCLVCHHKSLNSAVINMNKLLNTSLKCKIDNFTKDGNKYSIVTN